MKNILLRTLAACALLSAGASHAADFAIIVNKTNASSVDKALVARLYTGDAKTWADGSQVSLIDQNVDNPLRAQFTTEITGKSVSSMKALWAQHAFSGKALPPKIVDGDADVKKAVAANKNAIGYIKATSVDDSVKVVN